MAKKYIDSNSVTGTYQLRTTPTKGSVWLSIDDCRTDVSHDVYELTNNYSFPVTIGMPSSECDKAKNDNYGIGITDGKSLCKYVIDHGGEVALHGWIPVWSESLVRNYFATINKTAYQTYNTTNGTSLTNEEYAQLIIDALHEQQQGYCLDDTSTEGCYKWYVGERSAIEEAIQNRTYGSLAVGGGTTYSIEGESGYIPPLAWGSTESQVESSKYELWSDKDGNKDNYCLWRNGMATFSKNNEFDESSFRKKVEDCISKKSLLGFYWHELTGTESDAGTTKLTLDIWKSAMDVLKEYVDNGLIEVTTPSKWIAKYSSRVSDENVISNLNAVKVKNSYKIGEVVSVSDISATVSINGTSIDVTDEIEIYPKEFDTSTEQSYIISVSYRGLVVTIPISISNSSKEYIPLNIVLGSYWGATYQAGGYENRKLVLSTQDVTTSQNGAQQTEIPYDSTKEYMYEFTDVVNTATYPYIAAVYLLDEEKKYAGQFAVTIRPNSSDLKLPHLEDTNTNVKYFVFNAKVSTGSTLQCDLIKLISMDRE